jgi:alkanesulfonate monooxygenase SsuD/methylene tetrahydromethanopterin reductase-like flavin-dependent oxidoreductase (luciferase family)
VRGPDLTGPARLPALAVILPQFRDGPGPALDAVAESWQLGFAGGFLFDHLWPLGGQRDRPALECWTLLAGLAARARELTAAAGTAGGGRPDRFRLGTLVTRAGLRPPALLARMAATVTQVAGSPLVVGVGIGDCLSRDENLAFGLPFRDLAGRAEDLDRTVAALRGPLAGRPAPEVWVGGIGPLTRAAAGRSADAWNGWGLFADELAAGLADVRRHAERAGRDPGSVTATWGGQVLIGEDAAAARAMLARWGSGRPPAELARTVAGDPAAVAAHLTELGQAGATWCVISLVGGPGSELRRRLARCLDTDTQSL